VGRQRPHLAHGLWLIVILKCVTPPIWGNSLGVFSQVQTVLAANDAVASISPMAPLDAGSSDDVALSSETIDRLSRGKLVDESEYDFGAFATPISGGPTGVVPRQRIGAAFWGVLAAGAVLGFLVVGVKFATCVRRINKNRVRDFDDELNQHVAHLCRQLRIRHVPEIIVSDVLFGPAVLGIFRHTIVLPKCLLQTEPAERTVTPESLNPILVHELLHIRRGDLFTGTLQAVVQCLWWFHPAVWFANRMLSRDAERCCDEQVIAELGCGPAEYARSLLSVIESKQPLQAVPVFPGMKPVEITSQRMERIMSLKHGCQKRMPLWNWAIVLGFGLLVLPGAASQNSDPTTAPTPTQRAVQLTETPAAVVESADARQRPGRTGRLSRGSSDDSDAGVVGTIITPEDAADGPHFKVDLPMTLSRNELVDYLNRQTQGLESWRCMSTRMEVRLPNAPSIRMKGNIACQAPRHFRLTDDNVIARVDLGSNDNISWFYSRPGEAAFMTWKHEDSAPTQQVPSGVPCIDPNWLMLVLGVKPLDANNYEVSKGLSGGRELWLSAIEDSPSGRPLRRVIKVDTIRGVTHEHAVYDSEANLLVRARLSRHQSCNCYLIPSLVRLQFPQMESEITLTFEDIETNPHLPEELWRLPENSMRKDQPPKSRLTMHTRVYSVADLVVPIQKVVSKPEGHGSGVVQADGNAATKSTNATPLPAPLRIQPIVHNGGPALSIDDVEVDFAPLVELIRTSVATDTWARENGPGRIKPHRKTLSMVVRQTREAHDEIVDLLNALREEHNLLVVAEARIVQLPENKGSDWLDQAIKLNPSAEGLRWALSTEIRCEKLLLYVREGGGQMISSPRITTLPGHTAEISVSSGDKDGRPSGVALSLIARPLSDGNLLRLDYRIGVNESLENGKGGTGLLKSGQTLVFEYVAGSELPMLDKAPYVSRLFRNLPDHSGRYLVTITPRLVRADVEEELPKSEL